MSFASIILVLVLSVALCVRVLAIDVVNDGSLRQPTTIESPCVRRWRLMTAHASHRDDAGHIMRSDARPLMFEVESSELEVTLSVEMGRFETSWISFNTRTFNQTIPAPTIMVCPGDRLKIRLYNRLEPGANNVTNIHLHGLHVSPQGTADNVLRQVQPGGYMESIYDIRPDHPSGTFWYHPHSHGIVNTQLAGLMAGALIVIDRPDDYPHELSSMEDTTLLLQGICVSDCQNTFDVLSNAIRNQYDPNEVNGSQLEFPLDLSVNSSFMTNASMKIITNGLQSAHMSLHTGEFKRLRTLNAIPNNLIELTADGCELYVLAMDGIYWPRPERRSVVVLPPGGRSDIAFRCNDVGTFALKTEASPERDHSLGPRGHHRVSSQTVLSVRVQHQVSATHEQSSLPAALPQLPAYMREWEAAHANDSIAKQQYAYQYTVDSNADSTGLVFGVNGKPLDPQFINHTMKVGQPEHWNLSTSNSLCSVSHQRLLHEGKPLDCHRMNHPFHIHSTHFQVTGKDRDIPDELYRIGEWRDTLPLYLSHVEIQFTPGSHLVGNVLTHCHIASHADQGMAQVVAVVE